MNSKGSIEVGMRQNVEQQIIKSLIKTKKPYLTAQELADSIHVSRRTIFNNIPKAKELCEKSGNQLISVKTKGYRIEGIGKVNLNFDLEKDYQIKPYNEEYRLYILYLLLTEEEELHISELSEILFLSRPTIYKILNDITKWLAEYDLKLNISRKGVKISDGEKRKREVIKNWLNKAEQFLDKNKNSSNLKLDKCFNDFMVVEFEFALSLVKKVCDLNKLFLSRYELDNMTYLLETMVFRIMSNKHVSVRDRTIELCLKFFTEEKFYITLHLLEEKIGINISNSEMTYLLISILNSCYIEETSIKQRMQEAKIDEELLLELLDYLKKHLNIVEEDYIELINNIEYIVKREIMFKIKVDKGESSKYYGTILKKYQSSVIMAHELFSIISSYYKLEYDEKTICNIAFSIMSITHKNKKSIKVALFHNCDVFEFNFVFLTIQNFPYISLRFSTDNRNELDKYLAKNKVDLVITTTDFESDITKVLKISKVFSEEEIIETFKIINKIYQDTNFSRIVRGINLDKLDKLDKAIGNGKV